MKPRTRNISEFPAYLPRQDEQGVARRDLAALVSRVGLILVVPILLVWIFPAPLLPALGDDALTVGGWFGGLIVLLGAAHGLLRLGRWAGGEVLGPDTGAPPQEGPLVARRSLRSPSGLARVFASSTLFLLLIGTFVVWLGVLGWFMVLAALSGEGVEIVLGLFFGGGTILAMEFWLLARLVTRED